MKENAKYFFLLLVFIPVFAGLSAQTKEEQIRSIRKLFEIINKDTTLKKVTLENEEFLDQVPDNGGKLIGFYKKKEIRKIYQWIGISNGIRTTEFYFNNGQLIFVYERFDSFIFDDKKNQLNYNKTKLAFEGRYYFENKKLFKEALKGNVSLSTYTESKENGIIENANENLERLVKKTN